MAGKLLSALEQAKPDRGTSLSTALQSAYGNIKRKGLLIVISDFLDDANEVFKALDRYRHRGFEVILFHVLHHHEYRLPKIANANFIDSTKRGWMTDRGKIYILYGPPTEMQSDVHLDTKGLAASGRGLGRLDGRGLVL